MLMDKKTFGDSVSSLPSVGRNNGEGEKVGVGIKITREKSRKTERVMSCI